MTSALVELSGVVKTYGEGRTAYEALKGIDLRIEEREFVSIMGPSGSGKSTLMNLVGCLDIITGGAYQFRGTHVEHLTRSQRALLRREYLGFVFQGYNLLATVTARENVELPLLYRGVPAAARLKASQKALAAVGLSGWEHHRPSQLSGGEQQRVAVARAIVTQPALLLADEPTGNLDTRRSQEIMDLLIELNRTQGITVLMVTHEPKMADQTQRIVHLVDGRIDSDHWTRGS
jgi:putative ABC transport system ATP-binding protein